MLDTKTFLMRLTQQPGIYQMLGAEGKILYIGKARNLKKRLASYFSKTPKDTKIGALLTHVVDIQVTVTHNENEALLLECNLIKKYQPHYNVLFRDDKSYPYILITQDDPYPCINFYRGNKKTPGFYFGPYPNAGSVRETIYLIQKLFGLRVCKDRYDPKRTRPCLQYQIGLCSGSCASLITKEDYHQDVAHAILFLQGKNETILKLWQEEMTVAAESLNYEKAGKLRDQIRKLREIQARQYVSAKQGDVDVITIASNGGVSCIQLIIIRGGRILGSRSFFPNEPLHSSKDEILTSFITQHYLTDNTEDRLPKEIIVPIELKERRWLMSALSEKSNRKVSIAHQVRSERKKWLEMAEASVAQSLSAHLINKSNLKARFHALDEFINLNLPIQRIECVDVSHTMGEATVGSCVVFNREGPIKSDYRRYNIQNVTPGDDIHAMRQMLLRRFKNLQLNHAKFPDVLLIDGGVAQLNAVKTILQGLDINNLTLLAVAKGITRKPGYEVLYINNVRPIQLPNDSLALLLIQQIRDEAHRFAVTGHRRLRDKKRRLSLLEGIDGIGAKRRRELLRYFGGIQAINRASLEELTKVPGISQALAKKIFTALHDE